jgi:AcrR family transcriptional regulator
MYAKSESTIAAILSAAEKLFLARNYADVSMDDIARAAGVTKGALYHHFASKKALYLAMMHADLKEKQARMRSGVELHGACRERLRQLTESFLQQPPEKRNLIKLVRRDINTFKGATRDRLVRAYQATLPEQVEVILRDGIRDGELAAADPRLLSWMYVAIVEVALTSYAEGVLGNNGQMLDFVLNLFFRGAGKAARRFRRQSKTRAAQAAASA